MNKHLVIYRPNRNAGEQALTESFIQGLRRHGEAFTIIPKEEFREDEIDPRHWVVLGRLASSFHILHACQRKGVPFIYFDKGYIHRGWHTHKHRGYIRFAVNDVHPLHYFLKIPRLGDRWKNLGVSLEPRQRKGDHVLYAGCTHKFAAYHQLDPLAYTAGIIEAIKKITDRPILYRPKPGGRNDLNYNPIPGTILSDIRIPIEEELKRTFAVVTFSSNAALDAILHGVPAFVLGPGIAQPVSNTDLSKLNHPYFPTDDERLRWCHSVAYCQWQVWEIEEGRVWQDLKMLLTDYSEEVNSPLSLPKAVGSDGNNSPRTDAPRFSEYPLGAHRPSQ